MNIFRCLIIVLFFFSCKSNNNNDYAKKFDSNEFNQLINYIKDDINAYSTIESFDLETRAKLSIVNPLQVKLTDGSCYVNCYPKLVILSPISTDIEHDSLCIFVVKKLKEYLKYGIIGKNIKNNGSIIYTTFVEYDKAQPKKEIFTPSKRNLELDSINKISEEGSYIFLKLIFLTENNNKSDDLLNKLKERHNLYEVSKNLYCFYQVLGGPLYTKDAMNEIVNDNF